MVQKFKVTANLAQQSSLSSSSSLKPVVSPVTAVTSMGKKCENLLYIDS